MSLAISNGIFAVLFVLLLFYQLKDSAKREKKYQDTISALSRHLEVVKDIGQDVYEIKNVVVFSKKKEKKSNEI
jgi:preprotein translocase subunit YajC